MTDTDQASIVTSIEELLAKVAERKEESEKALTDVLNLMDTLGLPPSTKLPLLRALQAFIKTIEDPMRDKVIESVINLVIDVILGDLSKRLKEPWGKLLASIEDIAWAIREGRGE